MSEYLATVERFFVILRRQGLMLSATDVSRVQAWQAAGVPCELVCRGIGDGATRFRELSGEDARLPSSLGYYAAFVDDALSAERAEPHVAAAPEVMGDASDALGELAWVGQQESDPRRRAAYRAAWRALKAAVDLDRETALQQADSAAVDAFVAGLDASERVALNGQVDARLGKELPTLGVRGSALRRRVLLEDLVASRYGLIRLSGD